MAVTESCTWVRLDQLKPHPDNPKLFVRDHVVERIKEWIEEAGGFSPAHALKVREHEGGYQIIGGHHRAEAAKRAGLTEVPCWVVELDDDRAYIELIRDNEQEPPTKREIGRHARKYKAPRGSNGKGLKAFAAATGHKRTTLADWCKADAVAEAYEKIMTLKRHNFADGSETHLREIHAAPRESWPTLVGELLEHKWTVKDTKKVVERVVKLAEAAGWHRTHDKRFATEPPGKDPRDKRVAALLPVKALVERHLNPRGRGYEPERFNAPKITALLAKINEFEQQLDQAALELDLAKGYGSSLLWWWILEPVLIEVGAVWLDTNPVRPLSLFGGVA